jgi:hypothetical protein
MKPILLSTLLGGLIAFTWSAISWMGLPWHEKQMRTFANEEVVREAIVAGASSKGMYFLPGPEGRTDQEWQLAASKGPLVVASVRPGSHQSPMWLPMLISLCTQLGAAFLISVLVRIAGIYSYEGRVLFVMTIGLLAGLLGHMPSWTWWEFPTTWVAVEIADLVIGWFLAGLAIAAFTARPRRGYQT